MEESCILYTIASIEAPTSKITMQNQKYNAMQAKMDVNSGSLDTPDEQGVAIQPDLQIKEFLHLFLCHQRVQNTFVNISILLQLEMKAQLRQQIV